MPNAAPEASRNSSGDPQIGLLGRLLALQAEQSRYQPARESREPPPSVDPNVRQLSRFPAPAPPRGTIGSSNLADGQSNSAYSGFGEGAALDLLRTSQQQ